MKKKNCRQTNQDWRKKPSFGCLYVPKQSNIIHMSIYYFKERLRLTTNKEYTKENWEELRDFLDQVGKKIKQRTFNLAKALYWLDDATKERFSKLEGNDYNPEPEHVLFGDLIQSYLLNKVPYFASLGKQKNYNTALNIHILPYFKAIPMSKITTTVIDQFIFKMQRHDVSGACSKNNKDPLALKTVKNTIIAMRKVWESARKEHHWNLQNPFSDLKEAYAQIADKALHERNKRGLLNPCLEQEIGKRDVFLLKEWQQLREYMDPHYHIVMELLLMGIIGSELEALRKDDIKEDVIWVNSKVLRGEKGEKHLIFTLKTESRIRRIPLTSSLRILIDRATASSKGEGIIIFKNDIQLEANKFLLTMKDGTPFNYCSFCKLWRKAMRAAGIARRVPYASRHTLVQWALLIGITKTRLVDLMGHATKKMIDEVYGKYRKGLVEEREAILDYLGEDFLGLEELKIAFPERYKARMAVKDKGPETATARALSKSFSQLQQVYPDNYLK